jgi:hypothetical protein
VAPSAQSNPQLAAGAAAAAAIAGGMLIKSASTPALNGTYAVDANAQGNINAVVTYILLNGNFPNGAQTLNWTDMSGVVHAFPNTATFNAFATGAANFVYQVATYGYSGGTVGTIPSNRLQIP